MIASFRRACRLFFIAALLLGAARGAEPVTIEAFVREGCPHCVEAEAFLAQLAAERPELTIVVRDLQSEPQALQRLQQLAYERGAAARVPAVFVNGQLIVGFSRGATENLIRGALAGTVAAAAPQADSCEAAGSLACGPDAVPSAFEVTLFGRRLTVEALGLPAFALALGLLDGFNPCSMWVLLLMISLLAPLRDRRRMLAIVGAFVLVQGIAYFVFMAAWLNLFLLIGLSYASQLAIAAIAIAAGLIHIKGFVFPGRGVSLSIPDSAKPGIYARMRRIVQANSYVAAIAGAVALGVLVQLVELMCTSGLPALFTRILTLRGLDAASYYGYLLLYDAAYMLDDFVVLGTGVAMLSRYKLQEREGRWLKLAAGLVMVGLGVYLIVAT